MLTSSTRRSSLDCTAPPSKCGGMKAKRMASSSSSSPSSSLDYSLQIWERSLDSTRCSYIFATTATAAAGEQNDSASSSPSLFLHRNPRSLPRLLNLLEAEQQHQQEEQEQEQDNNINMTQHHQKHPQLGRQQGPGLLKMNNNSTSTLPLAQDFTQSVNLKEGEEADDNGNNNKHDGPANNNQYEEEEEEEEEDCGAFLDHSRRHEPPPPPPPPEACSILSTTTTTACKVTATSSKVSTTTPPSASCTIFQEHDVSDTAGAKKDDDDKDYKATSSTTTPACSSTAPEPKKKDNSATATPSTATTTTTTTTTPSSNASNSLLWKQNQQRAMRRLEHLFPNDSFNKSSFPFAIITGGGAPNNNNNNNKADEEDEEETGNGGGGWLEICTFDKHELIRGKHLGRGGFSDVEEVQSISLLQSPSQDDHDDDDQNNKKNKNQTALRGFMSQHCVRPGSGEARYAIKRLRADVVLGAKTTTTTTAAAADSNNNNKKMMTTNTTSSSRRTPNTSNTGATSNSSDADHDYQRRKQQQQQQQLLLLQKRYWAGIIDLVVETKHLSRLEHPHIIKLRAVAKCIDSSNGDDGPLFHPDYFLVLDRLYDTLQTRIYKQWKPYLQQQQHHYSRRLRRHCGQERQGTNTTLSLWWTRFRFTNKKKKRQECRKFLQERLGYALDLSSAIAHLHDEKIIHRDIKPDNIGFDVRGDIKIFDFGLARELPTTPTTTKANEENETLFHLSHMTGSLRYMAPENALGLPYNAKCDVYSFCIVLWEMLSCKQPFAKIKQEQDFIHKVCVRHVRPHLRNQKWPMACKDILRGGWHDDVQRRWTIHEVKKHLRDELVRLRHGDETGIGSDGGGEEDGRRRSTFIFRP